MLGGDGEPERNLVNGLWIASGGTGSLHTMYARTYTMTATGTDGLFVAFAHAPQRFKSQSVRHPARSHIP